MLKFKKNKYYQFPDIKYYNLPQYSYWYCLEVKDRPEVYKLITESYYAYLYCIDVKDRKEIRKLITDHLWIEKYNEWDIENVEV